MKGKVEIENRTDPQIDINLKYDLRLSCARSVTAQKTVTRDEGFEYCLPPARDCISTFATPLQLTVTPLTAVTQCIKVGSTRVRLRGWGRLRTRELAAVHVTDETTLQELRTIFSKTIRSPKRNSINRHKASRHSPNQFPSIYNEDQTSLFLAVQLPYKKNHYNKFNSINFFF